MPAGLYPLHGGPGECLGQHVRRRQADPVDAVEINSTAASASNLAYSASTMLYGTVDGTGTQSQTQIETTATSEATANHFVGRAFFFIDGALALQAAKITAYSYTGGRGRFTVEQMTDTPGSGDKFIIV